MEKTSNNLVPKYSVVIPVFNSETSLEELCRRIDKVFISLNKTYELILVNDCSKDNSWGVIKNIKETNCNIRAFNLAFNVGQFAAIFCGLEYAKGEYIITMDDDLQNPPEEIPKLIEKIGQNNSTECVYGIPQIKQHNYFRNAGSSAIQLLNDKIWSNDRSIKTSGFRLFKKDLKDRLIMFQTRSPAVTELIFKLTANIENVEVHHDKRKNGKSNYNLMKLGAATFDSIVNYSTLPLQYVARAGIATSLISFLIAIFFTIQYLRGIITQPGFFSIIVTISFFSGIILLSIGVLGEYIMRIIKEVNNTPKYIIKDIL
jgi:polyisoprenyl-phosphate glycosyltransferase